MQMEMQIYGWTAKSLDTYDIYATLARIFMKLEITKKQKRSVAS